VFERKVRGRTYLFYAVPVIIANMTNAINPSSKSEED
jgi:hypothetical protein